jgi:hypothetical protein
VTARRVPTIAYLGTHITERRVVFLGGLRASDRPSQAAQREISHREIS